MVERLPPGRPGEGAGCPRGQREAGWSWRGGVEGEEEEPRALSFHFLRRGGAQVRRGGRKGPGRGCAPRLWLRPGTCPGCRGARPPRSGARTPRSQRQVPGCCRLSQWPKSALRPGSGLRPPPAEGVSLWGGSGRGGPLPLACASQAAGSAGVPRAGEGEAIPPQVWGPGRALLQVLLPVSGCSSRGARGAGRAGPAGLRVSSWSRGKDQLRSDTEEHVAS